MRLIDADKYGGKVIASHCCSGVSKLVSIDDVPTAYDVDKVVEQLEAYSDADEAEQLGTVPIVGLADAIKIVKAGGKNE
jgi:hypothetical protein